MKQFFFSTTFILCETFAEKLPFLHMLHLNFNIVMPICLCVLLDQSNQTAWETMEDNVSWYSLCHSYSLYIRCCLVRWWPNHFPLLSNVNKSGRDHTLNILLSYLPLTSFLCCIYFFLQTTYENFRYRYDKKENPYKRGLLKNVKEVFFAKIPPSQLDLRAMVPEEDDVTIASEYQSEYSSSVRYDSEMGGKLTNRDSPKKLPMRARNLDNIDLSDDYDKSLATRDDVSLDLSSHLN